MGAGRLVAAPARVAQVVGEALVGHAVECRRGKRSRFTNGGG
jgi:hypothetical protein